MWLALLLLAVGALAVFCIALQRQQSAWERAPRRIIRRPSAAQYVIRASRTDDLSVDDRRPVPVYSITTVRSSQPPAG